MNVVDNSYHVRHEQGFEVYMLSNQQVELAVVPELGARIISLKDLRTGREWLWHPSSGAKLFRNREGDDFAGSPLFGVDECLPTIAPCCWQGRQLPDHGEVWAMPWSVDSEAWENGVIRTSAELKISPMALERTIELEQNQVRLTYHLNNRSAAEELYLWALHPLLRLQAGDRLELPGSTRSLVDGAEWVDALGSAHPKGNCEKIFAWPLREGFAAMSNAKSGDRLEFGWDVTENDTLGLWLNCGGWHGHHHFALEPSNGEPDALATAAQRRRCGMVPAHGSTTWQIALRVGA